jgi:hypothetical protein
MDITTIKGDLPGLCSALYLPPANPFHHSHQSVALALGSAQHPSARFRRNWINFPLRDHMIRTANLFVGGDQKPSESRILDMYYRVARNYYMNSLHRATVHRLRRGLTRYERTRILSIVDNLKRRLDRVFARADSEILSYVVKRLPFETQATKKLLNIGYLVSRGTTRKSTAVLTPQDRAILGLVSGMLRRDDPIVRHLLADVTEVLDTKSLNAMILMAVVPWMVLRIMVSLSEATWVSIEDSIKFRYAVYKIAQGTLIKLRDMRTDKNASMLQQMISNLEVHLGDSHASMNNVMNNLNEKRVRNKMESIVLAKADLKMQERLNRAMDTDIKYKHSDTEVTKMRREFYMWLFAFIVVVSSAVFMILTNGKDTYIMMAVVLMALLIIYAIVMAVRK